MNRIGKLAFSASITETTTYEYDPALPGRVVFEDGEFLHDLTVDPDQLKNFVNDPAHAGTLREMRRRCDALRDELEEIDINPVIVHASGCKAVDALLPWLIEHSEGRTDG